MNKLKFITIEQVLEMIANKEKFTLVEVLEADSFKQGHIPGAINLPVDKLENIAPKSLKKTDVVVVYCASYSCHASTAAAEILLKLGYSKTVDFKGGKKLWVDAGLDLET